MKHYKIVFLVCLVIHVIIYFCKVDFKQTNYPLGKYIENPDKIDTTCISEINEAKMMVDSGIIVFCHPVHFDGILRQEKQLKKLCKQHGIIFYYEHFSDMIFVDQTQGCFGAYMDKVIANKFGADFKEKLLEQADSIMVAVNDTVAYYLCDKKPTRPDVNNEIYDESEYLKAKVPEELRKQLKADIEGYFPFMDIGFYIDKEGNTSGYFLNNFVDRDHQSNQNLKDELFNLGVEQLKQIKNWIPGIVRGQKVITENNVRVFF